MTIILTTHYMEEADYLCGRIAIMDHGKFVALDTPAKLKDVLGGDVVCAGDRGRVRPRRSRPRCRALDWIKTIQLPRRRPEPDHGKRGAPHSRAHHPGPEHGVAVNCVHLRKPSLEDVFLHFTGRTIREQEASAGERSRGQMMGATAEAMTMISCDRDLRPVAPGDEALHAGQVADHRLAGHAAFLPGFPRTGIQPDGRPGMPAGSSYIQFLVPGIIGMTLLVLLVHAGHVRPLGPGVRLPQGDHGRARQPRLDRPRPDRRAGRRRPIIQGAPGPAARRCSSASGSPAWPGCLPALVFMLLIAFTFIGLGLIFASRMKDMQGFGIVMNFIIFPLFFLSGALYPAEEPALGHPGPVLCRPADVRRRRPARRS